MSNLTQEVKIQRLILGHCNRIYIYFTDNYGVVRYSSADARNNNEDEDVVIFVNDFVRENSDYLTVISAEQFRLKIIDGFRQLRENYLVGDSSQTMEISLVPEEQHEPHFSCKMNENEDDTTQSSGEN